MPARANARPATFSARIRKPGNPASAQAWGFVLLPQAISDTLPRRGRVSVELVIGEVSLQAQLEPDGQRSHWLRLDAATLRQAGLAFGDTADIRLAALPQEPRPALPKDLAKALAAQPEAHATWQQATPLAQVDWIHWIESAKQASTRSKRVADAVDMLASGKKRVCCFDPSGFYSKALSAPAEAED